MFDVFREFSVRVAKLKHSRKITKSDLKKYVSEAYIPTGMVLAGVGGVDHSKLSSLAEKYFGDLSNEYAGKLSNVGAVRFTGSEVIVLSDSCGFTREN